MNNEEFEQVVEKQIAECKDLLLTKGEDYTVNADRLSNFKENAERLGLTPIQVWAVYWEKHINAIEKWVMSGKLASEPIESRFADAINYLLLGRALYEEAKNTQVTDPPTILNKAARSLRDFFRPCVDC